MYKRINITLADEVLARADEFAGRERYTRSGLIAAALEAFTAEKPDAALIAREDGVAYAPRRTETPAEALTLDRVSAALRAFFSARDDVEAAWVFGSVARGNAGPMSDVDVAVLPRERLDKDGRWQLRLDLMKRLPRALGASEVDVAVLPDVSVTLAHRATVQGIRVYGIWSGRASEVEMKALRDYCDFAPVREALAARLSERLGVHATG